MTPPTPVRPNLGRYSTFGLGRQEVPGTPVKPEHFLRWNGGTAPTATVDVKDDNFANASIFAMAGRAQGRKMDGKNVQFEVEHKGLVMLLELVLGSAAVGGVITPSGLNYAENTPLRPATIEANLPGAATRVVDAQFNKLSLTMQNRANFTGQADYMAVSSEDMPDPAPAVLPTADIYQFKDHFIEWNGGSANPESSTKQGLEFEKAALKIKMYGEMAKVAVGLFFEGMKAVGGMGDEVADQWAEDMGRMVDDAVSMAMKVGKALVTGDWVGAIVKGLQVIFGWFTRNKKAAEDAAKATAQYNAQFKFDKQGYGTRTVEQYSTGILFWQTDHYKESVDEASKNLALNFEGAVVSGIEGGMNEAAQSGNGADFEKALTDSLKSAALKGLTEAFLNSAEVAAMFGPLVKKLVAAFKSGDKEQIQAAIAEFKAGIADLRPELDALAKAGKMITDELSGVTSSPVLEALGAQGKELELQYKKGLISAKEYNAQVYDLTLKRIEAERQLALKTGQITGEDAASIHQRALDKKKALDDAYRTFTQKSDQELIVEDFRELEKIGAQRDPLTLQRRLVMRRKEEAEKYQMALKRIEAAEKYELEHAGSTAAGVKEINDKYDLQRAEALRNMGQQVIQDRLKEAQEVLDLQQQQADLAYQKGLMSEKEYQALKLKLALDRLDAEQQAAVAAAGLTAEEIARINQKFALQREKLTLDFNADSMAYTATQIGDMMRKAIRSGVESGVKSGLKNAITTGSTEGLGRAIRETVGNNILDALIDTFTKSAAMKAIIEPAMEQLAAAIASPDTGDDQAAYAAFDKALASYSSKAEDFAAKMTKTFGRGGLMGPGATDGTITNKPGEGAAGMSGGSVAFQLASGSTGGFTNENAGLLTNALTSLRETLTSSPFAAALSGFNAGVVSITSAANSMLEAAQTQLGAAKMQLQAAQIQMQAAGGQFVRSEPVRRPFGQQNYELS